MSLLLRLERLAADIFDTICGPSIIHPAAHYRKIVQNVVQCLTSSSYNPQGETYTTGSSDVEGIFTSLLDGGFDWTVCGWPNYSPRKCLTNVYLDPNSQGCGRVPKSALGQQQRISEFPLAQRHPRPLTNPPSTSRRSTITVAELPVIVLVLRRLSSLSSCVAFTSCFLLLSFISLVPMFATLVHSASPTLPPFCIYYTAIVIVMKTLPRHYLT